MHMRAAPCPMHCRCGSPRCCLACSTRRRESAVVTSGRDGRKGGKTEPAPSLRSRGFLAADMLKGSSPQYFRPRDGREGGGGAGEILRVIN